MRRVRNTTFSMCECPSTVVRPMFINEHVYKTRMQRASITGSSITAAYRDVALGMKQTWFLFYFYFPYFFTTPWRKASIPIEVPVAR